MKILIIEDYHKLRDELCRNFETLGAQVTGVKTHSEARQVLASGHDFDLIISDVETQSPPRGDSRPSLIAFLQDKAHGRIPVVAISANEKYRFDCQEAGAIEFFEKEEFDKNKRREIFEAYCPTQSSMLPQPSVIIDR